MIYRSGETPEIGDVVRAPVGFGQQQRQRVAVVIGRRLRRTHDLEVAALMCEALPVVLGNVASKRLQTAAGTLTGLDEVEGRSVHGWIEHDFVSAALCELLERADGSRPGEASDGEPARTVPPTALLPPLES